MLKKIDHFFIVLQKHLGGIIFAVIFACCVLQVVFRYVLRMSSPWTEEFARVGMVYMTFLMAAYGIRMKEHPSVDFLVLKFPLRVRKALAFVMELLIIFTAVYLTIYGYQYVCRTVNDLSTTYHYPKAVWYFPIPVSGVIMLIYSVRNLVKITQAFIRNEECDDEDVQKGDAV